MTPVEGQWLDVRATMFIRGDDGSIWNVLAERSATPRGLDTPISAMATEVALVSPTGQRATVIKSVFEVATIMVPDWDEPHLVAALQGTKYRQIDAWSFPKNTPQARFEVAAHMLLMHRMSIKPHSHKENGPLEYLLGRHAIDHAAPSNPGWSPHVHVPKNRRSS